MSKSKRPKRPPPPVPFFNGEKAMMMEGQGVDEKGCSKAIRKESDEWVRVDK